MKVAFNNTTKELFATNVDCVLPIELNSYVRELTEEELVLFNEGLETGNIWKDGENGLESFNKNEEIYNANPDLYKLNLKEKFAAKRYLKEVGGLDFNDINIPTDRFTQSKISSAYTKAKEDPNLTLNWKTKDGWVQLDATTIISIGDALFAYVQSVYDEEYSLDQQIDAASTYEEIKLIEESL